MLKKCYSYHRFGRKEIDTGVKHRTLLLPVLLQSCGQFHSPQNVLGLRYKKQSNECECEYFNNLLIIDFFNFLGTFIRQIHDKVQ